MVECALALAMAFFSIMVLTMVSMGAGIQAQTVLPDGVTVAPPSEPAQTDAAEAAAPQDVVLIHYRGQFFDVDLKPASPETVARKGPVILAIEPSLPMVEALEVRKRVPASDLTVTTLDERWLDALRKKR